MKIRTQDDLRFIDAGYELYKSGVEPSRMLVQDVNGYTGPATLKVMGSEVKLYTVVNDPIEGNDGGREISDFATFIGGVAYHAKISASPEDVISMERGLVLAEYGRRCLNQEAFVASQGLLLTQMRATYDVLFNELSGAQA